METVKIGKKGVVVLIILPCCKQAGKEMHEAVLTA